MRRSTLASLALGIVLALAAVPAVLAADGDPVDPVDPTPTVEPTPTPCDTCGEITIDPPFETPTPEATPVDEVAPTADVEGITGRPHGLPSTDAPAGSPTPAPVSGPQGLVLILVGGASLLLLAGRRPDPRRR